MMSRIRGNGAGVPEYEVVREHPRVNDLVVFVFVINEGEKVRRQLERMAAYRGVADVVVADGGSTDGSLDAEWLDRCGVRALLVKRGAGRLSAQMRMAFDYALADGYQGVIVMDGNGKDGLEALPVMAGALRDGWDHVQGSRFVPGGVHENTPLARYLAVRLLHAPMISWVSGFRYTDTTNGFRAYSRRLLEDSGVAVFRAEFDRYQLHYHLAVESAARGFRVKEVPVARRYPAHGKTPTKIRGFGALFSVLGQLFAVCRGDYECG